MEKPVKESVSSPEIRVSRDREYAYNMKSFIAKRLNSILVNLRYLRFKLLKYKENKKICNTFDHNFKNIPLYIMRKVSLERYYNCFKRLCPYFKSFKNGA